MKQKLFSLIRGSHDDNRWSYYFGTFITTLIILNVTAIILESYDSLYEPYRTFFIAFEIFSVVIFSVEYLLRLYTSDLLYPEKSRMGAAMKFVFSIGGLIDLLAILPFYLPFLIKMDLRFLRALRLVRLLRVFKLGRYNKSIRTIGNVFNKTKSQLGLTIFVCLILIIIASTLMYNIENTAQPESFNNIGNAIWWAVATLTTVGYGDIYPITGLGKMLGGIIALLGIGLIALPTGIISSAFMEAVEVSDKQKQEGYRYCPHCGEKLV